MRQVENKDTLAAEEKTVFYRADRAADFPGGLGEFYRYISENIEYPADAKAQQIEGRVFVQITIDSTGYIRQDEMKIMISLCESCDAEAMRLLRNSPRWQPAYNKKFKKNIPMRMTLPILFTP